MIKSLIRIPAFITILFILGFLVNCTYDSVLPNGDYPDDVARIIQTRCATSGCHNSLSKDIAAGYDYSTWGKMFEGGRNGSSVIPFRPDHSFLMYFINVYPDLGISLLPTMPLYESALSHTEVVTIRDWISSGAPDRNGNIKFSGDPNRRKLYVCNQGCDLVTIIDADTRLPMRIIDVGTTAQNEAPHSIIISPDKQYWYVVFFAGTVVQKFRTIDDSFVGEVDIHVPAAGTEQWNAMSISRDSKYGFVVNWSQQGTVAVIDLETLTHLATYTGYTWPHGVVVSGDMSKLYVTGQSGNYIYKVDISTLMLPSESSIVIGTGSLEPHQVDYCPDSTKLYITCQKSNEVRVLNSSNDSLIAVIPTGFNPQELRFSKAHPYLFVSCMNDSITNPGKIGTVTVINYQTNTFIKSIFTGWQPHGLSIDEKANLVYVANRNVSTFGPAPHHSSNCGGRNGYMTVIDMTTLELDQGYKVEVPVDPYEIAVRD